MRAFSPADQVIFGVINASLLYMLAYWILGFEQQFASGFAIEDGPVEYGTAILLFVSALVLGWHMLVMVRAGRLGAGCLLGLYALLFVFGAGEEISWGQRILDIKTPEYFVERNLQQEITIHNLVVGGKQLTKTLFGSVLTVAILLYLVVLPLLYPRVRAIASLADRLMVPLPGKRHLVVALVASLMMMAIDLQRKWEVYELIFSLLTLSIFLAPGNAHRFSRSR
ncbi:hypothetical protein SAMN05443999_105144 [Roseovarius azorensis]|uniref:Uncharacterized protein n=1 Tax=Roseovarius azorensis TaxID=1287727 RepID=A0A1H7Q0I7_9RHOB|nr:hypothetical protein [Roseovarius azorensis]SEL41671.1 hypothetical protein SAMN05443999_105144 [Roseovarius azorensis]